MNRSAKSIPADAVFLDANVLLEILLGRPKQAAARKFIQAQSGTLCISTLTAHLVVHFGQAIVGLPILRAFLADYTVLALEPADFEWAFANIRNKDFEDALQLAVAIRNGCGYFMTFDKALVADYKGLPAIQAKLIS